MICWELLIFGKFKTDMSFDDLFYWEVLRERTVINQNISVFTVEINGSLSAVI